MCKSRFSEEQIIAILKDAEAGVGVCNWLLENGVVL